MTFKDVMMKVRRLVLCGGGDERKTLDIGSPTDVRRMDASEGMPGLSSENKSYIREKASNDAIRLLSLRSHPPTQPPSPGSTSLPPSGLSSREPSQTLLNAASSDLPPDVPTPPRQVHNDASPPASRMKSMWERTRRLSPSLASYHSTAGYTELEKGKTSDESVLMLDLDLDFKDKSADPDSPISVVPSSKSIEGFETQDTVGGTPAKTSMIKNPAVSRTNRDTDAAESSDSDSEDDIVVDGAEMKPLVKA